MTIVQPESPDPTIQEPAEVTTDMDYPAHIRTYNRFLNLMKSVIAHFVFLLPALYFFIVGHNPVAGAVLAIIAVVVLLYGLFRNPAINRDFNAALDTSAT